MTHDEQACLDQQLAYTRDYAEAARNLLDTFIKAEFTRDEAFALMVQYIDNMTVMYAST